MTWVPLHVHSQYSILDATASLEEIAAKAAEFGMHACALTDHGNLFGAVEFYKACKEVKVKPIIGCEIYVAPHSRLDKKKEGTHRTSYHLTLLAKNQKGYQNLCTLSSLGYLEGFYYHPRIDEEILRRYKEGLICLSGCLSSRLSQEILFGSQSRCLEIAKRYQEIFGEDYYLEVMRHPMQEEDIQRDGMRDESWVYQHYLDYLKKQEQVNNTLMGLSKELSIPLVATNDSHYMSREDWRAHEILLNVQSGEPCEIWEKDSYGQLKQRKPNPKRMTYASHEFYFKSPKEMELLFFDLPEAIQNAVKIAEQCHMEMDFKTKHYPVFIPPGMEKGEFSKEEQMKAVEVFLSQLCEEGIKKRYTPERLAKVQEIYPNKDPLQVVRERLNYEMSIIVPKGMADYLLIVWDFIHWAKCHDIPMGPGRGSGAGSIILYLIGVTDIEPLRFHLFFERFINPERISYPDIDVDICMDRRGDVIRYTLQKYGRENIAQIITFGTMKARMAIKDVGRVLSVPLSKVNEIAKLVPEDLNITLEKALEKDLDLRGMYERDEDARRIIDNGQKLEGSIRNQGIHAAGIIMSGKPLIQLIPLCNAKDTDMPVTQYSMKPVELVGMLKVDFLGLKTLTAIQLCVNAIKASSGKIIDWINLPLDDSLTFQLLNRGKTLGVFQLESSGMQELARELHLDKFEEIIAVVSLYRPGPMDMIPSFINRKHGREPIEYDHIWMKDILAETYGIMVYQEQVMQIASKLACYSLGEGDVLRRAMGKKDLEQMAKQREKFKQGALRNEIDEETSMRIFDKMEKFAAYGFNKSHAAAYGYLSYVTAYLKANYPKEWMAALMTCDSDDLSKVAKFIREAHTMNIAILPPDINEAEETFVAVPQGIRFAMNGIKGVGTGVVDTIIKERRKGGAFQSFFQFFKRTDLKKIGKKTIESLVDAGCFDFTGWTRDALRESVEPMYEAAVREQEDHQKGFLSLFTKISDQEEGRFSKAPQVMNKLSRLEILLKEKNLLGLFLTGHPLEGSKKMLEKLSCISLSQIENLDHEAIFRTAFILESVQTRISSKSQKKFAILMINDGAESYELPIWPELYEEKGGLLKENQLIYAVLQVDKREDNIKLNCKWFDDLTRVDQGMIESCDQAFDKAKAIGSRFNKSKKESQKSPDKKVVLQESLPPQVSMQYDTKALKLSSILQLKELFTAHRGTAPVHIDFYDEGHQIATLKIESHWGITLTPQLKEALRTIPGLVVFPCQDIEI